MRRGGEPITLMPELELRLELELEPTAGGGWSREAREVETYASGQYRLEVRRSVRGRATILDLALRHTAGAELTIRKLRLSARVPAVDVVTPAPRFTGYAHVKSHNPDTLIATATSKEFPYAIFGSRTGENRLAVGLLDLLTETSVRRGAVFGHTYYDSVGVLFERPLDGVTLRTGEYRESIYVSTERASWFHVTRSYWDWVDERRGYRPIPTPPSAYGPVWCSWVYLTDIDETRIWENAKAARELGIKTIVIDAGWYCSDTDVPFSDSPLDASTFGFGRVEADRRKFPDMAALVERIHRELGLYVWAWCTPRWTFRARQAGAGAVDPRLLEARVRRPDGQLTQFLCTRTPDAREHAARFTRHLLEKYHFDGLKFDCWELDDSAPVCAADHPHDTDTMGQGTLRWAQEIFRAMRETRPDAVVWFNNTSLKQYSNYSCSPNEVYCQPDENWRMSVLTKTYARGIVSQLMEGSWHRAEEDKNVARQLAVFIMGHVPELQVDLLDLRESHRRLIKAWLGFYERHRDALLAGDHEPFGFESMLGGPVSALPPNVRIDAPGTLFLWLGPVPCGEVTVRPGTREVYVLNQRSGELPEVTLRGLEPGDWRVEILDIEHREIGSYLQRPADNLTCVRLGIAEGALARLRREGGA